MQNTQVLSLGREDPLKKGMATHSSFLAWRIPWTKDPGRLQSKELPRVRHNRATKHSTQHTVLESNKKPSAFSSVLSLPVLVSVGNQYLLVTKDTAVWTWQVMKEQIDTDESFVQKHFTLRLSLPQPISYALEVATTGSIAYRSLCCKCAISW